MPPKESSAPSRRQLPSLDANGQPPVPFKPALLKKMKLVTSWASNPANAQVYFFWTLTQLSTVCHLTEADIGEVRTFVDHVVNGVIKPPNTTPVPLSDVEHALFKLEISVSTLISDRYTAEGPRHVRPLNESSPNLPPLFYRFSMEAAASTARTKLARYAGRADKLCQVVIKQLPPRLNAPAVASNATTTATMKALATFAMDGSAATVKRLDDLTWSRAAAALATVAGKKLHLSVDVDEEWSPICCAANGPLTLMLTYTSLPVATVLHWAMGAENARAALAAASGRNPLDWLVEMNHFNGASVPTIRVAPTAFSVVDGAPGSTGRVSVDVVTSVVAAYKSRYPANLTERNILDHYPADRASRLLPSLLRPWELPGGGALPSAIRVSFRGMLGTLVIARPADGKDPLAAVGLEFTKGMKQLNVPSLRSSSTCEVLNSLDVVAVSHHAPVLLNPQLVSLISAAAAPASRAAVQSYFHGPLFHGREEADGCSLEALLDDPDLQKRFIRRVTGARADPPLNAVNNPMGFEVEEQYAFLRHPVFAEYIFRLRAPLPSTALVLSVVDASLGPGEVLVPSTVPGEFILGDVVVMRSDANQTRHLRRARAVQPRNTAGLKLSGVVAFPSAEEAECGVDGFCCVFWDPAVVNAILPPSSRAPRPAGSLARPPPSLDAVSNATGAASPVTEDDLEEAVEDALASVATKFAAFANDQECLTMATLQDWQRRCFDTDDVKRGNQIGETVCRALETRTCPQVKATRSAVFGNTTAPPVPHYFEDAAEGVERRHVASVFGRLYDSLVAMVVKNGACDADALVSGGTRASHQAAHAAEARRVELGDELNEEATSLPEGYRPFSLAPTHSYKGLLRFITAPTPPPGDDPVHRREWQVRWGVGPKSPPVAFSSFGDLFVIDVSLPHVPADKRLTLAFEALRASAPYVAWYLVQHANPTLVAEGKRVRLASYDKFFDGGMPRAEAHELIEAAEAREPEEALFSSSSCSAALGYVEDTEKLMLLCNPQSTVEQLEHRNGPRQTLETPRPRDDDEPPVPQHTRVVALQEAGVPKPAKAKVLRMGRGSDSYVFVVQYADNELTTEFVDTVLWHFSRIRALPFESLHRGLYPKSSRQGSSHASSAASRANAWTMIFRIDLTLLASEKLLLAALNERLVVVTAAAAAGMRSRRYVEPEPAPIVVGSPAKPPKPHSPPSKTKPAFTTTMDRDFVAPPKDAFAFKAYPKHNVTPQHADASHFLSTARSSFRGERGPPIVQPAAQPSPARSEDRNFATTYEQSFSPVRQRVVAGSPPS